ncbi:MAG: DNA-protecting protein DprA [Bacteroidales bacterium]|nr:DNA-protecting protein DprA [Bacteroidales bacterium]
MSTYDETVAACALNKLFGDHPKSILPQVEEAGSALALFDNQLDRSELEWAVKELENVRKGGFRFLSLFDEDYPPSLRDLPDPPFGIYLNGSSSPTEIFNLRPMVAFVGTRDLSPYGRAWCQKLVKGLADAHVPPTIVSGLALGIDGVSHQTALECGLPTIGVMATGIEEIYPRQHESLARKMVFSPGCALVTDYPMHTTSMAWNFIRRNRIIAGLARAVVVVESKTKGGSLMTARYANDYGRDLYAVPGRLDDTRSAGCNSLIEAQMAHIITSPEQLADALGLGGTRRYRGQGGSWVTYQAGDPPEEVLRARLTKRYGPSSPLIPLALAIQADRGISAEALSARLHRPYSEILSAVGTLEADGIVTTDLLGRCSLSPQFS